MAVRNRATGLNRNKTPRWYYDFMVDGVRYKGAIPGARTKKDAEQVETQKKQEVNEGRYVITPKVGFTRFVEETYLPWARDNKRSWYDDELIARTLCEFFGDRPFNRITPMLVERFKKGLRETPTKRGTERRPATVNRALAVLSKIFALAADAGAAGANPCARVRKLRADNARVRYLLPDEEARLMAALEGRELLRDIVVLAMHTGMRRGEILKLRWSDVDSARDVINVRQTKTARDRVVPMGPIVRGLLEARRRDGEYVFVSPRTGGALVEIKKGFRAACDAAKVKDFRFHDLRHTAATRLADAGANTITIARILGHSTIQMSARYTHATDEATRAAVERVAEASAGAKILRPNFVPKDERRVG